MATLVLKFGGSSLATRERIQAVAERIVAVREGGHELAVVVSAMGDSTDELIELAGSISARPPARELDLLLSTGEITSAALMAIAICELGPSAVALTGPQAGMLTDGQFGRGRITSVSAERVQAAMRDGGIPVMAGFQGLGVDDDIVALRRGESDTSAVALAVGIGADRCEIYTDVEGIYTADPRCVREARKLDTIIYEETLEMAKLGARVIHPRAVEIAQQFGLPVVVRSSFSDNPGTRIVARDAVEIETTSRVRAVAHDADVGRITVRSVSDRPGLAHAVFEPLAEHGINVDVIVQNVSDHGVTDISFTLDRADLERALELMRPVATEIGARDVVASDQLAKVSVVGVGMETSPGTAARMFGALADAGINIVGITTSEIRITCLVDEAQADRAAQVLHSAFGLGDRPAE